MLPVLTLQPDYTHAQNFSAFMFMPGQAYVTACGSTAVQNPTYITDFKAGAFKRVWVNYMIKGTTYVYWEFERSFSDPGPYTFQLQASHAGTPRADDWFNVNVPTSSFFTTDVGGIKLQRMFGKTRTLTYRVVLTTLRCTYVSPIAATFGVLNKHDYLIVREVLRKEELSHKLFTSEKGYLLKARRYGKECAACRSRDVVDTFTDEIVYTNHSTCYGTGFIDGYYPPTTYYALIMPTVNREMRDGRTGTVNKDVTKARFLGTLPLVQNDVFVSSGSDDRYYIHSVTTASQCKSVPIVYQVELRAAPFTDAIYDFPLPRNDH